MSILSTPFDPWIKEQVEVRQKSLGKFGNISENDLLAYNTKAPFLRLASSIDLTNNGSEGNILNDSVLKRLIASGFREEEISDDQLAKKCILQGGVVDEESQKLKAGLNDNNDIFNGAYGWGGIEERGFVPMPGITNADITYYDNGTLSRTAIEIRCFSKKQFALIDTLFLRPGYTLLLEFGHSVYLDNKGKLQNMDNFLTPPMSSVLNGTSTPPQIRTQISKYREETSGNYEAVLGQIHNFKWQFNPDGSYNCLVQLTGMGDVFSSIKTNISLTNSKDINPIKVIDSSPTTEPTPTVDSPSSEDDVNNVLASNQSKSKIDSWLFELYQSSYKGMQVGDAVMDVTLPTFRSFKLPEKDKIFKKGMLYRPNLVGDVGSQSNPRVYIKYGVLLAWIQSNLFLYNKETGKSNFEFDFNFDNLVEDENYILNIPGQISTNPLNVLIPYTNFTFKTSKGSTIEYIKTPILEILSKSGFFNDKSPFLGKIANLYVSINLLSDTLASIRPDEDGVIILSDFLKLVNQNIISSMGSINSFSFKISQDGLKIKLVELIPQRFKDEPVGYTKLNVYGVKPGIEGSFVREINMVSEIDDDFSNNITIGAQSNGNQVGGNALSFSNYNAGLIDRVNPSRVSSNDLEDVKTDEGEISKPDQVDRIIRNMVKIFNYFYLKNEFNREDIESYNMNMTQALKLASGCYTDGMGRSAPQLPAPFFLPFNLSLTLDGISGPRLFQKFLMTDEILPPSYEKDGVALTLSAINHSINTSGWVTKFETISVSNIRPLGDIIQPTAMSEEVDYYQPENLPPEEPSEPPEELIDRVKTRIRITRFFGMNVGGNNNGGRTQGYMEVLDEDESTVLFTLATTELPWLGNENGVSCIPSSPDPFLVRSHVRPQPKPNNSKCFWVVGNKEGDYKNKIIKGNGFERTSILIHDAPIAKGWLQGCIAPGFKFNEQQVWLANGVKGTGTGTKYFEPAKNESISAMKRLIDVLWSNDSDPEKSHFKMEIKNINGVPDGELFSPAPNGSFKQDSIDLAKSKGLLPNPANNSSSDKTNQNEISKQRQKKKELAEKERKFNG